MAVYRNRYRELIIGAARQELQPLGVTESIPKKWLINEAGYLAPPGPLQTTDLTRLALPLLVDVKHFRLNID